MLLQKVLLPVAVLALAGFAHGGEIKLAGDFVQGGLVVGEIAPGSTVEFDGRDIRVSETGVFIIGFGRDEGSELVLAARFPNGTREERAIKVAPREYKIERVDGVPPRTVNPDPEDFDRIRAESALIRQARSIDDARTDFLPGFTWPAKGRISGVYGSQRVLNGEPRRPHYGVDVAAPTGSPVYAPADGLVTLSYEDMFYSGGTLILDHGHGLSSTFLHMSKLVVEEGVYVKRGDKIGEIGATGRATGPHLDWRMNLLGRRLDPQLLVGDMPE